MTELVAEVVAVAREPKKRGGHKGSKRHKPKYINKVGSITARCKGCGTLIVMRVQWRPGPILNFAEEIIASVKACHSCGRQLEMPQLKDILFTLSDKDDAE